MKKVNLTHLENIIKLLEKSSFMTRQKINTTFSSYTYGPAGVLTSRNLSQLLWNSLVTSQVDTYPVEDSVFVNSSDSKDLRSSLSEGTLRQLPNILKLVNYTLPFAIVQRGLTFPKTPKYEDKFLFDSSVQTEMVLQYFCKPGTTLQSFDRWIQYRLQWWRKHSKNPSQISSSEIETIDDNTTTAYIQCQFPWGMGNVEEITNKGGNPICDLEDKTGTKLQCINGKKSCTPHLIECNLVLEHCLMACISDAYTKSVIRKGKQQTVCEKLNLHPKIAPYKLSVVNGSKSRSNEIQEVASYINKDLRQAGIDVFHAKDSLLPEDQFKRNDLMGMPYTAILNEDTVEMGTLNLRNKDTTLVEKIHLTQLKEIILKNIQL